MLKITNNFKATIHIILKHNKTENGNIFGGYTEQSWAHGSLKFDRNAFILSLINQLNRPLKIKCEKSGIAIMSLNDNGPIFGVRDILISNESNTNKHSYSNLGRSFIHPDYSHGSNEAKSFLAGSEYFQVSEIEVYTKQ